VATTTTNIDGEYVFEDVPAGDYFVVFDASTGPYGNDFNYTQFENGPPGTDSDAGPDGRSSVFSFDPANGSDTTIDAGLQPTPRIGTVKEVAGTNTLGNGNVEVSFEIGYKNTGVTDLNNISLVDDLDAQIGVAYQGLASPVIILSSTATNTPALDPAYDGDNNVDIFAGAVTDVLEPGQEVRVQVNILIDPSLASYPISNQATASGECPPGKQNGSGDPVTATDDSDDGTDFEGTNPDAPGDNGTSDDPTILTCDPANIVITGEPAGICPGDDVTLNVTSDIPGATYEWTIEGDPTIISTDANPTFSFTDTMVLVVKVSNSSGLCFFDLRDTTTINVFDAPTVNPVATYSLNADCSASDLSLSANANDGGAPYSYVWTGPNSFSSTLAIQ